MFQFNFKHYQNGNQAAEKNGSRFDIRIQTAKEIQPSSNLNILLVPVRYIGRTGHSGRLLHEPHKTRELGLGEEGGVRWKVEG